MTSLEIVMQYSNFVQNHWKVLKFVRIRHYSFVSTQYCYFLKPRNNFQKKLLENFLTKKITNQYENINNNTHIFLQLVCFVEHILIPHQLLIAQRFLLLVLVRFLSSARFFENLSFAAFDDFLISYQMISHCVRARIVF